MTPEQSGTLQLYSLPPRLFLEEPRMISFLDRLARAETEADREQFVRGFLGVDKFHAKSSSIVSGWIAGSLITKIVTDRKWK